MMYRAHKLMCAALATLALAGCAANPVMPPVVKVPVPVPCRVEVPARPAMAVDALPIGATIWEQMRALRAERVERMAYEGELEAAVRACQ